MMEKLSEFTVTEGHKQLVQSIC